MDRRTSRSPRKRQRGTTHPALGQTESGSFISNDAALEKMEPQQYVKVMGRRIMEALEQFRHYDRDEHIAKYFATLPANLPKRPAPPIALRTISAKIENGEYRNLLQLSREIWLKFKDTLKYYQSGTMHHEYAKLLQAEADRFYNDEDELPWPEDWSGAEDETSGAESPPRKRRSPRPKSSSSNEAGPSQVGRRRSVVKAESFQREVPSSDSAESVAQVWEEFEEDGEMIIASTPVTRKGKGKGRATEVEVPTDQRSTRASSETMTESAHGSDTGSRRVRRRLVSSEAAADSSHSPPVSTFARDTSASAGPSSRPRAGPSKTSSPVKRAAQPSEHPATEDLVFQSLVAAQDAVVTAQKLLENEKLGRAYAAAMRHDHLQTTEQELEELREENDNLKYDAGTIEKLQAKVRELEEKLADAEDELKDERRSRKEERAAWNKKEQAISGALKL